MLALLAAFGTSNAGDTDGDGVTPATESEGGTGGLGAGLTSSAGTCPISARSLNSRAHFLFSTYNSAICVQMLRKLLSELSRIHI